MLRGRRADAGDRHEKIVRMKAFFAEDEMRQIKISWRALTLATIFSAPAFAADDAYKAKNPAAALELPRIEVIGTTPLPGVGLPLKQVPSNVQVSSGKDIGQQKTLGLADYLEQNLGSVNINQGQDNPFQPDVNFRGFTASPLLGTPQGISVFMDGVRVNEAFGDLVNWDLIPQSAISSIQLNPGSNPVFGLNTLGGALAIYTKSGFQHPGERLQLLGGSFGRRSVEFDLGGHGEVADYFITGNVFKEDGWREHSSSDVKQLFAKFGAETEFADLDVSFLFADNRLEGVQALPLSMLGNPRQAYTWPDITTNKLNFVNVKASHFFTPENLLAGNVYYRGLKTTGFNSNVNDRFDPLAGGNTAFNDSSSAKTDTYGASLQYTYLGNIGGKKNQFVLGASIDAGRTNFRQFEQAADFTADRGTVAIADFAISTDVETKNRYLGIYFSDTLSLSDAWSMTLSGRENRARIDIRDNSGLDPALNGSNEYSRFNPAVGISFAPRKSLTTYASYSEGLRAPSPVELTCADPDAPCKLPNNFLADPPLKPVTSKTIEAGLRGELASQLGYSAAVFRTDLEDDIQFVSSGGALNSGFFQNVGNTRREGVELGLSSKLGSLGLSLRYSYIKATFRSPFSLHSPNNSSADANGDIAIQPGNRIAGIPLHTIKLRADYAFNEQLSLGMNVYTAGKQYARGDENNRDASGQIPGFTVLGVDGRYQFAKAWRAFIKVTNLTDRKYDSFGVLGENFFRGAGQTFDATLAGPEQFRTRGAPRGVWVGIEYQGGALN